jgi:DNA (cytosine-5)-methyltransferase 1
MMRLQTCASLFSGGGGWDVGAMVAGLTPRWAVEMVPEIAAVYAVNVGDRVPGHKLYARSVFDVDPRRVAPVDVLFASPPCQAHSTARMRAGLVPREDEDAGRAVIEFIGVLRPRLVLLENVAGYRHHSTYKTLVAFAVSRGYACDERLVACDDYGVPSSRQRLIARFWRHGPLPPWPAPRPAPSWRDAVADLLPDFPASTLAPWQKARLARMVERGAALRYQLLISSNNVKTKPFKAGETVIVARSADEPAWTIVATYKAMSQMRVVHADDRVQLATPRAFARWQSFPDSYRLPREPALATRIVGNAVPPALAVALLGPFL